MTSPRWITPALIAAAVLVVLGALFTLQGIGLVGGSAMSGNRTWAVIGPIMIIVGAVLALAALRSRRTPQR